MTVSSITNKVVASGNGVTTVFSYNFQINNASDVVVIYTDATGISTTLTTAQYTITGIGSPSGGTVTYPAVGSPIASGTTLTIARILALTQPTSISNQGAFYPTAVEAAIDRAVMEVQQISELIGRTITGPITDATAMAALPSATQRASKALLFDASGNPIAGSLVPNGVISSVMAPFCASASLTSAYALLRAAGPTLTLAEGGTGATTASGVRANIGAQATIPSILASDYGVLPANTAAANTTAMNALLATVNLSPGATILFNKGTYNFNAAWNQITGNNIVIQGMGPFDSGTVFNFNNATGNCITFNGTRFSGIRDICMLQSTRRTSGYGVVHTGEGYMSFCDNMFFQYHYNAIQVSGTTETRVSRTQVRYNHGIYGIVFTGGATTPSYRMVIDDLSCDNPYPAAIIAAPKTWAPTTAFNTGDLIISSGNIYQCSATGTSGVSTPSGIPGVTAADAFTATITDGSVSWKFVASSSLAWVYHNNYAYSLVLNKCALIDGAYGIRSADIASTGTSYPEWIECYDVECDHNYVTGIYLGDGSGFYSNGGWFSSCLAGNGILVGANYKGEVAITNSRIFGNYQHGILVEAGPVVTTICNNHIGINSTASAATFHGVAIGAGASRFVISNNVIGTMSTGAANPQGWAVLVNAGTSDHYIITNNVCFGNVTGTVSDSGTGANKTVSGNVA
jgi:hypothetical protein